MNRFIVVARPTLPGRRSQVDFPTAVLLVFLACLSPMGCVEKASPAPETASAAPRRGGEARTPDPFVFDRIVWQTDTGAERPAGPQDRLSFCGRADGALEQVASRLALRQAHGLPAPDALELAFLLRAEGEPHVWPHAWTLSGGALEPDDETARLGRFVASIASAGSRRCGVARARAGGREAVAAVVVDALADLVTPVPTRAHVGQWLRFEADMLVPASAAKLVILGPSGLPRTVPTTLHGRRVEAAFAVERPGPFTVQLLANVEHGPRPVLETMVFVDVAPPARWVLWPVPGEEAAAGAMDDESFLRGLVNGAREAHGLPALARDRQLDRAAAAHAGAMRAAHLLGHDAGDGNPLERIRRLGIQVGLAGENVAHEASILRAHRALWASPSHRENILDERFRALGVGVVRDTDASLWICEIFTDFDRSGRRVDTREEIAFRLRHEQ